MDILIIDDEPLARERIREMLKKEMAAAAVSEAGTGAEALKKIGARRPDIMFVDIQMPDMDGFQMLETLSAEMLAQIPAIIFVTAYDQHALKAFKFHALDYLLKPFDRERFAETIARAKAQIESRTENNSHQRILKLLEQIDRPESNYLEWLTIKKDERIRLLKVEDIHWIEAQGNYVLLKFAESSELLRETMDSVEAQLNPKIFVRIHRSGIININHIKEFQVWRRGEYRALMKDGKLFTLSRSYRHNLDEFLKKPLI